MKCTLVLTLIFTVACAPQKTDLEKIRAEVMKIHDDSMEKIGSVRKAVFDLEEHLEGSSDSVGIKNVIMLLENADEEMMLWMSEYQEPENEEELKLYYEKEKERIQVVANKIYKSLEDAEKYLNQ